MSKAYTAPLLLCTILQSSVITMDVHPHEGARSYDSHHLGVHAFGVYPFSSLVHLQQDLTILD